MKKSTTVAVVSVMLLLLLALTLFSHVTYFERFHSKVRPITEDEKETVTEIIKERTNFEDFTIKFGNVYMTKNRELVKIRLTVESIDKYYLVDIEARKVLRR